MCDRIGKKPGDLGVRIGRQNRGRIWWILNRDLWNQ